MGFSGPDNRGAGGMVQRRATERNKKVMGTFGQGKREAKGGDG
jgi:hypothetical protein